ncbi:MAG TPA: urate hydroxylase PuuD [Gemmatimonadaceae bacterium]|nr:urate hydroxylase PuuD [Gemmatimonadaceae bacterium]
MTIPGGVIELADLVARWVHVIAGIMWIGNSMLFNWLDRNLRPSSRAAGESATLGEIWLLHSGGFYFVEKTLLAGEPLPRPLHWFKWQAYTTWLSGMALLVVVYYLGGRAVLADPTVALLGHGEATLVGLAAIAGGWSIYEAMQRFVAPRAPRVAAAVWIVALTAIAVELTRLLNGRAAFLHVGAMLGTIMAANVFFTIIPSQRELVATVAQGRGGDPKVSARAKRVSIHNNYFTFPVIVLMVSGHFPSVYGNSRSWLLLVVLVASGVAVRHVLNVRFGYPQWKPALAGTLVVSVVVLYALLVSAGPSPGASAALSTIPQHVSFADARHVLDRRCAVCHSAQPADLTFGVAPAGVMFDTPEQIAARVLRIRERAVVTRTMPPANKTNITDAERALLARWIDQGALVRN